MGLNTDTTSELEQRISNLEKRLKTYKWDVAVIALVAFTFTALLQSFLHVSLDTATSVGFSLFMTFIAIYPMLTME